MAIPIGIQLGIQPSGDSNLIGSEASKLAFPNLSLGTSSTSSNPSGQLILLILFTTRPRPALQQFPLKPMHQHSDDVLALGFSQSSTHLNAMPFQQTTPATAGSGMLGDEHRVAPVGRLFTIIGNLGGG